MEGVHFSPYITISRCQRLSDNSSAHTPPQKSSSMHTKSNACFYFALSAFIVAFSAKHSIYCHNPPENAQKWPKTVVRPTRDSSSMHSTAIYQWSELLSTAKKKDSG
jgi:hypothetical protein